MSSKEIFGIIVRTLGLILLLRCLWLLVLGVMTAGELQEQFFGGYKVKYFLFEALGLAVSLYLLRGAPHLIKYSYPDQS